MTTMVEQPPLPLATVREVGGRWFWIATDADGRALPDAPFGGPILTEREAHAHARVAGYQCRPEYVPIYPEADRLESAMRWREKRRRAVEAEGR